MTRSKGFTVVEAILIVAVLAIIGAVGYLAYTNFFAKPKSNTSAYVAPADSSTVPVVVNNGADLNSALTQLDSISISDSDGSQLDGAAKTF